MTRTEALKQARKRWKDKALIQVGNGLSSADKRSAAHEQMLIARQRKEAIDAEIKARLQALDWYQQLMAERREVAKTADEARSWLGYYKFKVGQNLGYAFMVEGSGDTWEDAFRQADQKAIKETA